MNKHKVRVSCRAIIRKGKKLFLVRQKHLESNNKINDFWCTIGGGLDPGETLVENLKREIKEEVGVDNVVVGRLLYIMQFSGYGTQHLEFFYEILNVEDFKSINLSKTSHGEIEISEYGFLDPKTHNSLPLFLAEVCDDLDNPKSKFPFLKSYL